MVIGWSKGMHSFLNVYLDNIEGSLYESILCVHEPGQQSCYVLSV